MLRLLLVRHGETEWNAARRFQGQADPELSPVGLEQGHRLARRLSTAPLDCIISSDLRRARRTAEIIGEGRRCPQTVEPDLRELSFGEWEGLTYAEIRASDPDALSAWEKDWVNRSTPGGESLLELERRVGDFLERLKQGPGNQTLLLVAHSGPLQVLICRALDLPVREHWKFQLDNASLSEINCTGEWASLRALNDICHLSK